MRSTKNVVSRVQKENVVQSFHWLISSLRISCPPSSDGDWVRFDYGWFDMPVFECSRKVQCFGSSLAMTLPALFVKANEVEKGSIGKVFYGLNGVLVVSMVDEDTAKKSLIEIMEKLEIQINQKKKTEHMI